MQMQTFLTGPQVQARYQKSHVTIWRWVKDAELGFAKHEQDPKLKDKLAKELPGILNMCLTSYASAVRNGFTQPASSETAKQEWRLEADQVAQFVDDVCTRDADAMSKAAEVFSAYKDWALENGIKQTMSQKGLRERLTRLGFGYHKDRVARYVTGLSVSTWP